MFNFKFDFDHDVSALGTTVFIDSDPRFSLLQVRDGRFINSGLGCTAALELSHPPSGDPRGDSCF